MSSQTTQQTTAARCALGKGCPGTGWHLHQSATEAYHRSLAAAGLPAVNTDPLGDVRLRPWQSAEIGTAEPGTLFSADRVSSGLSNVSVSRGEEAVTKPPLTPSVRAGYGPLAPGVPEQDGTSVF